MVEDVWININTDRRKRASEEVWLQLWPRRSWICLLLPGHCAQTKGASAVPGPSKLSFVLRRYCLWCLASNYSERLGRTLWGGEKEKSLEGAIFKVKPQLRLMFFLKGEWKWLPEINSNKQEQGMPAAIPDKHSGLPTQLLRKSSRRPPLTLTSSRLRGMNTLEEPC